VCNLIASADIRYLLLPRSKHSEGKPDGTEFKEKAPPDAQARDSALLCLASEPGQRKAEFQGKAVEVEKPHSGTPFKKDNPIVRPA
jgi:hypothetical protein